MVEDADSGGEVSRPPRADHQISTSLVTNLANLRERLSDSREDQQAPVRQRATRLEGDIQERV